MKYPKLVGTTLVFTSAFAMADNDDALAGLALQSANYSFEQAIEKAYADYKGQITEFEVEDENNQLSYEIEMIDFTAAQKHKLVLSLEDGTVLKDKSSSIKVMGMDRLDDDELRALKELQASDFKLRPTMTRLQDRYKAEIVDFELENDKGITFYKFKLFNDQGMQEVLVDVKTSHIIPV